MLDSVLGLGSSFHLEKFVTLVLGISLANNLFVICHPLRKFPQFIHKLRFQRRGGHRKNTAGFSFK